MLLEFCKMVVLFFFVEIVNMKEWLFIEELNNFLEDKRYEYLILCIGI